jgi:hypothetical protein
MRLDLLGVGLEAISVAEVDMLVFESLGAIKIERPDTNLENAVHVCQH